MAGSLLATTHGLAEEPPPLKIGYVNLVKVFDGYQRTQESEGVLEQKGKQKQTELEGRVNELNKLRQGLELLNDQARTSKAREIEEKADAFQQFKTKAQRELVRERDRIASQVLDEIEQGIEEYAKANGFSVILDKRSLLYAQQAYEVTDGVLQFLNARYAGKKTPR